MPLFEDSAEDEIRRLRQIIAKLEETKGARVVTVEMEPKEGYGYLFYITAPTTASEEVFGRALAEKITRSFRVIGANLKQDVVAGDHVAPPRDEKDCIFRKGALGRWIVVNARDETLAWSGSRWVAHGQGVLAGGVRVSNFESVGDACWYAQGAGLTPILYRIAEDGKGITCLLCGMTSNNENDVRERYCGNCHQFYELDLIEPGSLQ